MYFTSKLKLKNWNFAQVLVVGFCNLKITKIFQHRRCNPSHPPLSSLAFSTTITYEYLSVAEGDVDRGRWFWNTSPKSYHMIANGLVFMHTSISSSSILESLAFCLTVSKLENHNSASCLDMPRRCKLAFQPRPHRLRVEVILERRREGQTGVSETSLSDAKIKCQN